MSLPNMTLPLIEINEESEIASKQRGNESQDHSDWATIEVDCQIAYQRNLTRSASQRRVIIPLPVSPMSSDSPPSDSDEDDCSPEIKLLDPAHRPSPRALHVLRQQHPPINVNNSGGHDEPWSRRSYSRDSFTRGTYSQSSWGNPRSASSVENLVSFFPRSGSYPGSYEEIGESDEGTCRSKCCTCVKRFGLVFGSLSVAMAVSAAPTIFVSHKMLALEGQDPISFCTERPEIVIPIWLVSSFVLLAVFFALLTAFKFVRRKYLQRQASFQDAIQFARETMPEYGSTNHARLGFLDILRQNGSSPFR